MQIQKVNSSQNFGMLVTLPSGHTIEANEVNKLEKDATYNAHAVFLKDGPIIHVSSDTTPFEELRKMINDATTTGILSKIADELKGIREALTTTRIKK